MINLSYNKKMNELELNNEEMTPLLNIIEKYKERTKKDCYKIVIEENVTPDILESKIGGNPYIPEGEDLPKNKDGEDMPLLIQINFSEFESNIYPQSGILQIYMNKELDYPPQYKIRFYKEISDKYKTEFPKIDLSEFVYEGSSKIHFEKGIAYMPASDFRSGEIIKMIASEVVRDSELVEKLKNLIKTKYNSIINYVENDEESICELITFALFDYLQNPPIALGGYADFTQTDPRDYEKEKKNLTECLIKIDEEGNNNLYIGDCGIISVIISEKDLKNCNYENAILDWDCC